MGQSGWTWQYVGNGTWYFGEPIRGLIRKPLAIVHQDTSGLWTYWQMPTFDTHGRHKTLIGAIEEVEQIIYAEIEELFAPDPSLPRGGSSTGRPKEERI